MEFIFQIWERGDASGFLGLYISDLVNSVLSPKLPPTQQRRQEEGSETPNVTEPFSRIVFNETKVCFVFFVSYTFFFGLYKYFNMCNASQVDCQLWGVWLLSSRALLSECTLYTVHVARKNSCLQCQKNLSKFLWSKINPAHYSISTAGCDARDLRVRILRGRKVSQKFLHTFLMCCRGQTCMFICGVRGYVC